MKKNTTKKSVKRSSKKLSKAQRAAKLSAAAKQAWATRRKDKSFNASASARLAWVTRREFDELLGRRKPAKAGLKPASSAASAAA